MDYDYEVIVVGDERLAGEQWVIAREGDGRTLLLVTRSAMAHNPERVLTRAWLAWESQRALMPA